jgi:putative ABC transport system permease protein
MILPISYHVRSLLVRKTTTIATALGVALVVFVLAASLMLSAGIKRTLGASGHRDHALVLRKGSDAELASNLETRLVSLILAAPGVKHDGSGSPLGGGEVVIVIALEKAGTQGQVSNVQVRGVPEAALKLRPDVRIVEGRPAQPGTDEVMIGRRIRGRFNGVDLGSSFELKKNRKVQVVGVFEAAGSSFESEVWADVETVKSSFGRDGLVSSVTVALEGPTKYDAFAGAIEHDKQLGLQALRETRYYEKQSEGTTLFITAVGSIVAVLFSIGAMIGAMITMYAGVAQRKREIGTLRALGFSRTSILFSFLMESVLLAFTGGLVGALASLSMSSVEFSMVNFATWSEVVFTFTPTPTILLLAVGFGGLMGIVGGFLPAIRAARTSPVEAMRA